MLVKPPSVENNQSRFEHETRRAIKELAAATDESDPLFTNTEQGEVPGSGGGSANFLRADGTWAVPPGTGGVADGDKGDITVSGGGAVYTIDNDVVSFTKLQNIGSGTFVARNDPGSGDPEALTGTEATALLDVFTPIDKGLVPGGSGGGTGKFLRADGAWANPPGATTMYSAVVNIASATMSTKVTVTNADVGPSNIIMVNWGAVLDTDANSPEFDTINFSAVAGTGNFSLTIAAQSYLVGDFKINYVVY